MKRYLEPGTNLTRLSGQWMPGNPGPPPGTTSAGELQQGSPATAEPAASPGVLLAGDATVLTTAMPSATLVTQTVRAPHTEPANGRVSGEPPAPAGTCPRLVIADDDPVVQAMLGMTLGSEFEVVGIAADSEQAVEIARRSQPDAALIDVVMPKGGGLRAVLGILEVAPETAIVVLSGYKADGVVNELIQAGAVAYRRKGVAPRALADALTESIKVHTAERRESAWKILGWYCLSLDRRPRRRMPPDSP
jgi:CheY-like chemotaxis protein